MVSFVHPFLSGSKGSKGLLSQHRQPRGSCIKRLASLRSELEEHAWRFCQGLRKEVSPRQVAVDDQLAEHAVAPHHPQPQLHQVAQARDGTGENLPLTI